MYHTEELVINSPTSIPWPSIYPNTPVLFIWKGITSLYLFKASFGTRLLFDAITDSGDVICIQGRDLSTEYKSFVIMFIQNPISINSPITVRPVCQNVSLLLFDAIADIVEMSYAYKDEIWVQIICDSVYPKPNFC